MILTSPMNRSSRKTLSGRRQSGVTLIELLVAMIIGLLGTIVIFTVYQNAEGYKRTTVAAGDAQSNGAVALFSLERYIRTAGSSLVTTNESQLAASPSPPRPNLLLGCPLFGFPNGAVVTGPAIATTTPIAPVRIVDGSLLAGGSLFASDVIVIMAGNADIATNPTSAAPLPPGSTTALSVGNTLGWRLGSTTPPRLADIALFVAASTAGGAGAPSISPAACSARRITAMSTSSGSGTMTFGIATPAVSYAPSTNIHNLGPNPYFLSISVNANQELIERNFSPMLTGEAAVPVDRVLADGIISIQAQYGIDDNQDDVIDRWVEPTGVWANPVGVDRPGTASAAGVAAINKIKAIRVAVLARSTQYEPPNRNTNVCDATPNPTVPPAGQWPLLRAVRVTGGSLAQPQGADILPAIIASAPSAAANANWQCFRYRTFETVVPVLNMIRSPL
jgi:type IV pilus assembly protein PilW